MNEGKFKWRFRDTLVVIVFSLLAMGLMWVGETYGEPDTSLAFYKFQDNNKSAAHIQPETNYLAALESPKTITKQMNLPNS